MQFSGLSHVWLVRHGQSAGNLAAQAAEASGAETIEIEAAREVDVPLSPLGERQAQSLGDWFRKQPERPTLIVASPFLRAYRTAEVVGVCLHENPGMIALARSCGFDVRTAPDDTMHLRLPLVPMH